MQLTNILNNLFNAGSNDNVTTKADSETSPKESNAGPVIQHVSLSSLVLQEIDHRLNFSLLCQLLNDCNLINKLLKAWQEYFESSAFSPKYLNPLPLLSINGLSSQVELGVSFLLQRTGKKEFNSGIIGHLTIISNLITKNAKEGEFVSVFQSYFDGRSPLSSSTSVAS
jgi:hypothetical protein